MLDTLFFERVKSRESLTQNQRYRSMPTIKKLRNNQITLREKQVSIQKELTRMVELSRELCGKDGMLVLEKMRTKLDELANLEDQIETVTEAIQDRRLKNNVTPKESLKTPSKQSRRKKQKAGKAYPLNGKDVHAPLVARIVQGGSVGGGEKR